MARHNTRAVEDDETVEDEPEAIEEGTEQWVHTPDPKEEGEEEWVHTPDDPDTDES